MQINDTTGQAGLPEGAPQKGGKALSSSSGYYGLNPQIRALGILLCLSVALTLGLLFWSADAQDEISIAGSQRLADTALAIQNKSLRNTVTDYTFWDDAYDNVVKDFKLDWYDAEFGNFPYLTDTFGITATLIVGPGNRVVAYTHDGETKTEAENIRLGDMAVGLAELTDHARRVVDGEFLAASGFISMEGQPHIAAARLINSHSEEMIEKARVAPESTTIAVFIRPLDQGVLETIAADFGLMDLTYGTNIAASDELTAPISTIDGEPLGVLTWRIDRPSHRIFTVVLPSLLAVVSIIGLLAWYLLNIIKSGQQNLFTAMLEAKAANQAKSEFLATMSHELRTPMNGVIGIAEILKHRVVNDDQRTLLDHLLTAANDQMAIINDLLDMTRIEAGRIDLIEEAFDPASVVRAAVNLMSCKAQEKGLELQVELPEGEMAEVIGDSGRYKQIVLNLLSNAIKFTEEGKVTITLESKAAGNSEELGLTVEDTGIGIAKENQARVFERFMQADGSTTRKAEGSGLGLAICKALIEAMNGKIHMTSTPGEGTRVQVSLELPHAQVDAMRADAIRSVA